MPPPAAKPRRALTRRVDDIRRVLHTRLLHARVRVRVARGPVRLHEVLDAVPRHGGAHRVRAGVVRALDTSDAAPISLTDALVSRICWSGDAPANNEMDLDEAQHVELGRGKWAGDRFCIIKLDVLPELVEGVEEWLDVTDEVNALLLDIWNQSEDDHP